MQKKRARARRLYGYGLALAALCGAACTGEAHEPDSQVDSSLRDLTRPEVVADFDQLAASFKSLYGPLSRKEALYGFSLEQLVAKYRFKARTAFTESDVNAVFSQFISEFHDAHVSIETPISGDSVRELVAGIFATPIEGRAVVYATSNSPTLAAVTRGDVLLSVDGVSTETWMERVRPYASMGADVPSRHLWTGLLTVRPNSLPPSLKPSSTVAQIRLQKADGTEYSVETPWVERPRLQAQAPKVAEGDPKGFVAYAGPVADTIRAELAFAGDRNPMYLTSNVVKAFGITGEATVSAESRLAYGFPADAKPPLFATTYSLEGRNVLLLRIPTYGVDPSEWKNHQAYLRALFAEYQPKVDALILDEGHNPGGITSYMDMILRLLITQTANGLMLQPRADRKWITRFFGVASNLRANGLNAAADEFAQSGQRVEKSYDAGESLAPPVSIGTHVLLPDDMVQWKKGLLVVMDSLSTSCADFLPMILKANNVGTLFGERTTGAGGTVEQVIELTNSQKSVSLTRSLAVTFRPDGKYSSADYIEDVGVTPHVKYDHTVSDFRGGYVGYVEAFTRAALATVKAAPAVPEVKPPPAEPAPKAAP